MRIHLLWLEDFVALPPIEELKDRLTQAGIEIEATLLDDQAQPVALEASVSPNRPDLLSHLGIAREISAATQQRLRASKWRLKEQGADVTKAARVFVDEPRVCKRLMGRVIRHLKVGPSPAWLAQRLLAIGQKPINNVVDVTNYVMHELGQPLHAYDLSRLAIENNLPTLRVRRAKDGEVLTTLDKVARKLTPDDVVVADGLRPVALAGVMGGLDSQVGPTTEAVFVEAAVFTPQDIRRSYRRHQLRTEAAQHFERGVDAQATAHALERCAQLLSEVAEGEVAKGALEVAARSEPSREIPLRLARLQRILGIGFAAEQVVSLLDPLGLRCATRTDDTLVFEIPSYRPDLQKEVDLIEEVARRFGYDNLPERLPDTRGDTSFRPLLQEPRARIRQICMSQGVTEAVTFALASPAEVSPFETKDQKSVALLNPLGQATSRLRTSLIPGLLSAAARNTRHVGRNIKLFEIGETFFAGDSSQTDKKQSATPPVPPRKMSAAAAALPQESVHIGAVLTGERFANAWFGGAEDVGLVDAIGLAEAVVEDFDADVAWRWRATQKPLARTGHAGVLEAVWGDKTLEVGFAAELAPKAAEAAGLSQRVFVVEINVTILCQLPPRILAAQALPKFVGTRRDVAVVSKKGIESEALRQFLVAEAGGALGPETVEQVWLFDKYEGKPIAKDEVSYAFGITYRSAERTLTDDEVNTAFQTAIEKLCRTFEVKLRA